MMIEEQRAHAARQQRTRSGHVGQVNDQADGQVGKRRGVIEQTHARANSYSHSCHHGNRPGHFEPAQPAHSGLQKRCQQPVRLQKVEERDDGFEGHRPREQRAKRRVRHDLRHDEVGDLVASGNPHACQHGEHAAHQQQNEFDIPQRPFVVSFLRARDGLRTVVVVADEAHIPILFQAAHAQRRGVVPLQARGSATPQLLVAQRIGLRRTCSRHRSRTCLLSDVVDHYAVAQSYRIAGHGVVDVGEAQVVGCLQPFRVERRLFGGVAFHLLGRERAVPYVHARDGARETVFAVVASVREVGADAKFRLLEHV